MTRKNNSRTQKKLVKVTCRSYADVVSKNTNSNSKKSIFVKSKVAPDVYFNINGGLDMSFINEEDLFYLYKTCTDQVINTKQRVQQNQEFHNAYIDQMPGILQHLNLSEE